MLASRRLLLALTGLTTALGVACAQPAPAPTTPEAKTPAISYRSVGLDCGGWFSGFAMHSSGRLYGFGDVFGMWRSDDSGQSWKYLQGDFITNDHFINGCAVATGDPDKVAFIGAFKFFKSNDGGRTWLNPLPAISPRRDRGATPLIFHPGDDNELWLASPIKNRVGTLWRSTDGGMTWEKRGGDLFDKAAATTIYVRPEFPNQVWVGALGGLFVSADRGATFTNVWKNEGGIKPFMGPEPMVGAIARRSDGVGYIATNSRGWRVTATDYNDPSTYKTKPTVSWWDGWGPNSAIVLADDSFLTNGPREAGRPDSDPETTMRSTDGGLNWQILPMRLKTPPVPAWRGPVKPNERADGGRDVIVQDPKNPNRWHITGGHAPVISDDAGATCYFPPNGHGIAGVPTYKIRFPRANPNLALVPGSDQGGFTITDGGYSGTVAGCVKVSIDYFQTYHEILSSNDGRILVAAGVDQTRNENCIVRSTNGGLTWVRKNLKDSGLPESYDGITRAVAAPGNVDDFLVLLAKRGGQTPNNPGLYRTTDGGATFVATSGIDFTGSDPGMRYHPENSWLETDGVETSTRYLSLRTSSETTSGGLWRSTDAGSTWARTEEQPFGNSWIYCLAVDLASAGHLWVAGGDNGIRRSRDGGRTWTTIEGFVKASRVDAARSHVGVWGQRENDTWNKLYYSYDDGQSWTEATGPGYRFANLSDLTINPYLPTEIWVSGMSVNIISMPPRPRL
jgi:photosystem II stability/assembly factor-like uncharacterized protein